MPQPSSLPPGAVPLVGQAIQNLAAARLGRAFVPLGLLFLVGVGEIAMGTGGWPLAWGAPLAAGAMLAHGLRVVQQGFGRPRRPWMAFSHLVGVVPPVLGLYVFGWLGLRAFSVLHGVRDTLGALFFTLVGLWVLHGWSKLLELAGLADAMITTDGTGGDR